MGIRDAVRCEAMQLFERKGAQNWRRSSARVSQPLGGFPTRSCPTVRVAARTDRLDTQDRPARAVGASLGDKDNVNKLNDSLARSGAGRATRDPSVRLAATSSLPSRA